MSSELATVAEIASAPEAVSAPAETVEESKAVEEPKSVPDASITTASAVPEKDGEIPAVVEAPVAPETAPDAEAVDTPPAAPAAPEPSEESKPAVTDVRETKPPVKSEKESLVAATTPLARLFIELPSIIEQAGHNEMWGITLADELHVPTSIILEKFLRANDKDVTKAKAQLTEALKWRKEMEPLKLLADTEYDRTKFGNLGYVTTYQRADGKGKEIITWNIYGAVKDLKTTFGDIKEFIKWRCALMELSVKELDLASATVKIPENGPDPYRMIQVHDYLNISFLRMDPAVRAASKETIQTFSMAYPELLKEKFFVNVPLVMGWVFAAMKIFLSEATVKKFHPLSYGSSLAREIPGFGDQLPVAYGGKGKDIKEGLTVKYAGAEAVDGEKTA